MNYIKPEPGTVAMFLKRYLAITCMLASGALVAILAYAQQSPERPIEWRALASGVDYAQIPVLGKQSPADSLHVVRIDPRRASLVALSSRDHGNRSRTARQWCDEFGLAAVINAGMYDVDGKTHVGYMRTPSSVNNGRWNKSYESVLLLDGRRPNQPSARILDRAELDDVVLRQFGSVIQNLRLIKHPGVNVWSRQPRTWSESAIAQDRNGNILFLFLYAPLAMQTFNEHILHTSLGVVRAMHVEGGSEASLSICADSLRLHLSGSRENGIHQDEGAMVQLSIPNIVAVKR